MKKKKKNMEAMRNKRKHMRMLYMEQPMITFRGYALTPEETEKMRKKAEDDCYNMRKELGLA